GNSHCDQNPEAVTVSRALLIILSLVLVVAAGLGAALYVMSGLSTMAFDPPPKAIGAATPITVKVSNPHGMRRYTAAVEQDGVSTTVATEEKPATRVMFWR